MESCGWPLWGRWSPTPRAGVPPYDGPRETARKEAEDAIGRKEGEGWSLVPLTRLLEARLQEMAADMRLE